MAIKERTMFERRDAAEFLNQYLGKAYDWSQMLIMWSSRDGVHCGLKGSELTLKPCAYAGRTPLYKPTDVGEFILAARPIVPFVQPSPKKYLIDDAALASPIIPARMVKAMRVAS